jgi:hypothetical protein
MLGVSRAGDRGTPIRSPPGRSDAYWSFGASDMFMAGSEGPMTESDPRHESPRDRKRLARQAGLGRLSFISALAGVLVAYGAFALLAALVGAVAVAIGLDTELASNDWTTFGMGSAVTVTVVAFVAYLFGGYVAGRMARRAGLVNGLAVFGPGGPAGHGGRGDRGQPDRHRGRPGQPAQPWPAHHGHRVGQDRHRGWDRHAGRHAGRRRHRRRGG